MYKAAEKDFDSDRFSGPFLNAILYRLANLKEALVFFDRYQHM